MTQYDPLARNYHDSYERTLAIYRAVEKAERLGWPKPWRDLTYVFPPTDKSDTWLITFSRRDEHGALYMQTIKASGRE